MCYVDLSGIGCNFAARMSPTLSRNTALQHFECGNTVQIHNRITLISTRDCHMIQKLKFQVVMKYVTLCSTIFHAQTLDVSFHISI